MQPTENTDKYLSNKHVLLSSGGFKYDKNYYSTMNSSVNAVETTYKIKSIQSLSSTALGSTSNILLPNASFVGHTYLYATLPDLQANQILPRGWLLAAIDQITFIMGASNTGPIQLSGEGLYNILMAQCENGEARANLLQEAGQALSGVNPTARDAETGVNTSMSACLPLVFPWSCISDKLPFDSELLSSQITIGIRFKPASAIYAGSAAPSSQSFTELKLIYRQGDLSDKSLSLKHEMMRNPDMMYSYPFQHVQSFSKSFTGSVAPAARVGIPLDQFINADLVGIYGYAVRDSDTVKNSNAINPLYMDPIENVILEYNGQIVYQADNLNHRSFSLSHEGSSGFSYPYIRTTGTIVDVANYPLFIDFSRCRAACFQGEFPNTWRLGNQTLTLRLNTSRAGAYTLHLVYVYNGLIECKAGMSFVQLD